jgi:hypothetical protein
MRRGLRGTLPVGTLGLCSNCFTPAPGCGAACTFGTPLPPWAKGFPEDVPKGLLFVADAPSDISVADGSDDSVQQPCVGQAVSESQPDVSIG